MTFGVSTRKASFASFSFRLQIYSQSAQQRLEFARALRPFGGILLQQRLKQDNQGLWKVPESF